MTQEVEKLTEIYRLMYEKLTRIQLNHEFEQTMKENRKFSYKGKDDNYFFAKMAAVVFEGGIRAVVWKKYEPEIRKEFANYNVKKVAQFGEKDVERMLSNPKMFKHRKKIQASIHNANVICEISKLYGGFWEWLDSHSIQELVEELKNQFKWMGEINSRAFLKYVGCEVMKPDSNLRKIMYRLGLIDPDSLTSKTYKQIQEVGEKMAKAVDCRVIEVDYLFYLYGSGGVKCVQYQVCGVVPKCDICELTKFCEYYGEVNE